MAVIVNQKLRQDHAKVMKALQEERESWFGHWRQLSDMYLPRRYPWLMTQSEVRTANRRNSKLLSSTSTIAARTLASGMMNGVTSPSRPWFRLRLAGFKEEQVSQAASEWLDRVTEIIQTILAESNFYNAMAVHYLEWGVFGTASLAIMEDFDDIIRCYNYALGEFYLGQDHTQRVNRHARYFERTVEQLVKEFGKENISQKVLMEYEKGGAALFKKVKVAHLIEENKDDALRKTNAAWREVYWELDADAGEYLACRPFYEWPTVTSRWEITGQDVYGTSPGMDAYGDVRQLQTIILKQGQGLEKQVSPPLIVDQQLRNRPHGLAANGITYASTSGQNFGAKEAYKVNLPFQELEIIQSKLEVSIQETFYNHLFTMISQLDTVRSATEIDARREEKLVLLGSVLERFYNEGLDPALRRVYGIAKRKQLLPEPPPELDDIPIEVQYVSVLSDAQRSVGTVAIERFLSFTGELAGVYPEVKHVPNAVELAKQYAEGIGVKPSGLNNTDEIEERINGENATADAASQAAIAKDLAQGAKVLSDADVGGGQNALQAML